MIYIWLIVLSLALIYLFYIVDNLMDNVLELQEIVTEGLERLNNCTDELNKCTTELLGTLNDSEVEEKHICSECKEEMDEGYCIEDGAAYYCSASCLYKNFTRDEYMDLYESGNAYYTDWK